MDLQWIANLAPENKPYYTVFLHDKIVGDPQAKCADDLDKLEQRGVVGVYKDLDKPTKKKGHRSWI